MEISEAYAALQLAPGSSLSEVKSAYRSLVKKYHPDLNGFSREDPRLLRVISAYRELSQYLKQSGRLGRPLESPIKQGSKANNYQNKDFFRLGLSLIKSQSAGIRAYALSCLQKSGRKDVWHYVKKAFWDSDPQVVQAALRASASFQVEASDLHYVYESGNQKLKLAVMDLIAGMPSPAAYSSLIIKSMQEQDSRLRRRGINLFTKMQGQGE